MKKLILALLALSAIQSMFSMDCSQISRFTDKFMKKYNEGYYPLYEQKFVRLCEEKKFKNIRLGGIKQNAYTPLTTIFFVFNEYHSVLTHLDTCLFYNDFEAVRVLLKNNSVRFLYSLLTRLYNDSHWYQSYEGNHIDHTNVLTCIAKTLEKKHPELYVPFKICATYVYTKSTKQRYKTALKKYDGCLNLLMGSCYLNLGITAQEAFNNLKSIINKPGEKLEISDITFEKQPLLHIAVRHNSTKVIKFLLQNRHLLNKLNENKKSALAIACENESYDVIEELLKQPGINITGIPALTDRLIAQKILAGTRGKLTQKTLGKDIAKNIMSYIEHDDILKKEINFKPYIYGGVLDY